MDKLNFENLLERAKKVFYDVWITEGTPDECEYYKEYFKKYPNKGNYKEFYKKALIKHVDILFTSWDYETPTAIYTPEELLAEIIAAENEYL